MFKGAKVFRDNVHGYIKVPLPLVKDFIDTDVFQRLRFIEQTGMRVLYPSARHDRFIHSLGTFHLGQKAYEGFEYNVRQYYSNLEDAHRNHYNVYDDTEKNRLFWDKCKILFLIACLLHDCGHAPFSHTMEFVYQKEPKDSEELSLEDKIKQYYNTGEFVADFVAQKSGNEHERMGALLVFTEFRKKINNLIHENFGPEDDDNVEFVARMILGCKYRADNRKNQIKNCLISLLNSSSIDVDSLDYIIRDSKLSGIDNMAVDVDRLLSALTIVEKTTFDNKFINTSVRTNILEEGKLLYTQDDKAGIKALCIGKSTISEFNGTFKGKLILRGRMKFLEERELKGGMFKLNGTRLDKIVPSPDFSHVELDATIESPIKIEGSLIETGDGFNGFLEGTCRNITFNDSYVEGNITGKFSGSMLGNYKQAGGKLSCELGFHKSSLSVLQNVVSARNYEYQWIYSHHKVVYYSNYLLIDLFRRSIKYLLEETGGNTEEHEKVAESILSWKTMITDEDNENEPVELFNRLFYRTSDSDLVSLYKECYLRCLKKKDNPDFSKLLKEYFSRQYRKSVWKSYAEYSLFFSDLSDTEKLRLYTLIKSKPVIWSGTKYGYFDKEWNDKFADLGMYDVVWVDGYSKLKRLEPDRTFILFKDNPINFRTVSYEKDIKDTQHINLFYLYYNAEEPISKTSIAGLKEFLKQKLNEYIVGAETIK